jgi:hypothetical protein
MSFKKRLASSVPLLLSMYVCIWLGCIIPSLVESEVVNYTVIGIFLMILLTSVSLVFFTNVWSNRPVFYLFIGLNLASVAMTFVFQHVAIFLFAGLAQGLLGGILLKPLVTNRINSSNVFSNIALGIALSSIVIHTNFLAANNIIASAAMAIIMLILALSGLNGSEFTVENRSESTLPKLLKGSLLLFSSVLIALLISFVLWSLILKDDSHNLFHRLAFFIVFAMVFVFTKYISYLIQKLSNVGWLFCLTILLTLSLGLFYTFSFPILFILGFAFSIAYLINLISKIYGFRLSNKQIGLVLLGTAILNLIFGLFVQNHIEFIISIKIPDNVLALSARQAVVKELASGGAILIILAGILFLKRRTWLISQS